MSDIEVEPVDEIDEEDPIGSLDVNLTGDAAGGPAFILYGGKGGVGKTTMAAATGIHAAEVGEQTLVISTDPAHSLSDTYGVDIGSEPTRVGEDRPLWAVEIDPDAAMEEGQSLFGMGAQGEEMGEMGGVGDMLGGGNPMESLFGGTMPGTDEAVAMQQLIRYVDDDRYDRIVVDTAPTGHTLRFLELPELLDSLVGRIMSLKQQFGGLVDGMKGMFGKEEMDETGQPDLDELKAGIESLRSALTDPSRTDFRIVMVPEAMSVEESKRLREQLREYSIPVGTVVVNKVMEPLADTVDGLANGGGDEKGGRDEKGSGDVVLSPDLEDCAFCQRRWDVQQAALGDAQELFMDHEVKRVPLLAEEVAGESSLRVVAACLD